VKRVVARDTLSAMAYIRVGQFKARPELVDELRATYERDAYGIPE